MERVSRTRKGNQAKLEKDHRTRPTFKFVSEDKNIHSDFSKLQVFTRTT